MTNSRTRDYYHIDRKREMIDFANYNKRVAKQGHIIVDIDVTETLCRWPFVAFIQDNGELILTEWF